MEGNHSEFVKTELMRRAEALAKPLEKIADNQDRIEVMVFLLAAERYALETCYIREVWPLTAYVQIPHTPPFVLGVANVHGEICSIVDLKQFFSLPAAGITNLNKLVVLEDETMRFGILADDILGTEFLLRNELSSADEWRGVDSTYLTGVTRDRLIVLDAKKILTDKRLIVEETAGA